MSGWAQLSEEVVLALFENPVITFLRIYSTGKCQLFISTLSTSFIVYRPIIKMPACLWSERGAITKSSSKEKVFLEQKDNFFLILYYQKYF